MVSLGIRYLNGWAMATHPSDRTRAEWPPHPDRVFMALASAYFEGDGDPVEREALAWLERQGPPGLKASDKTERRVTTSFVPVNDTTIPRILPGKDPTPKQVKDGISLLPEHRGRQSRHFPVAIPRDPTVYLVWDSSPPNAIRQGLESLCSKMVRVGHSASLAQAWIEDDPVSPNLVPTASNAPIRLRVPGPGRMAHLESQFARGLRPEHSRWCGYDEPTAAPRDDGLQPVFAGDLLALRRVGGVSLGLEHTLAVTNLLRRAVLSNCPEPVPAWVSGHDADGRDSRRPHLAFLPLPHVGSEHADGRLVGMGIAIPADVTHREVRQCLGPLLGYKRDGQMRRLKLHAGNTLEWFLELERRDSPPWALRSVTWTRRSQTWATVTPIVFDRYRAGDEEMVALACRRVGLPPPESVSVGPVSVHKGVPHSEDFQRIIRKKDGRGMRHAHAVLTFDHPVPGPVLLGAGRFRGYGLCKPVHLEDN